MRGATARPVGLMTTPILCPSVVGKWVTEMGTCPSSQSLDSPADDQRAVGPFGGK